MSIYKSYIDNTNICTYMLVYTQQFLLPYEHRLSRSTEALTLHFILLDAVYIFKPCTVLYKYFFNVNRVN